uniref:Ovule protein n=1 Tax=Strongyloides venezuelensis TaxID=75913 RepID=A0A0K0F020_STRVS
MASHLNAEKALDSTPFSLLESNKNGEVNTLNRANDLLGDGQKKPAQKKSHGKKKSGCKDKTKNGNPGTKESATEDGSQTTPATGGMNPMRQTQLTLFPPKPISAGK